MSCHDRNRFTLPLHLRKGQGSLLFVFSPLSAGLCVVPELRHTVHAFIDPFRAAQRQTICNGLNQVEMLMKRSNFRVLRLMLNGRWSAALLILSLLTAVLMVGGTTFFAGAVAQTTALAGFDPVLLQQRSQHMPRLHSILVSHRGEMISEQYFAGKTANQPANLKSASKSVISALVGLALQNGYIKDVNQPIADFFPEYLGTGLETAVRTITVRNLLTMQSGLASTSGRNYGPWVASRNWVDAALKSPMIADPGADMIYSTGTTHLLSAIIARASGMNTKEFAQRYLADPMGFRMAYWSRDPQGVYFGGNDMEITPRQMLDIGEMYLNGGVHDGKRILNEAWVQDSHQPHADSPRGEGRHYGYGWWLRDMADLQVPLAWGYGGQFIFVVREYDLVIVITSDSNPGPARGPHMRAIYDLVEFDILQPLQLAAGRHPRANPPQSVGISTGQ
jgi:CubicO group peptidase (beta-lactamase class C family)